MKILLLINLMLFALVSGTFVLAQSQNPQNEDGCHRFKTPVRQAPAELDKSMLMAETDEQKLAKGKVVDPCRNKNVPVRVRPQAAKPFQLQPAAPKLPLMVPSPALRLKTPSEVLRDTVKPKQ